MVPLFVFSSDHSSAAPRVCFPRQALASAAASLAGRTHQPLFTGSALSRTEQNWTKLIPVSHCASSLCCSVFFFSLILSVSPHCPRGCFSACPRVLARYVSCQPWSRFLLRCLLDSGESCLLHPATLRLIALVRGGLFACESTRVTRVKQNLLPQGWWWVGLEKRVGGGLRGSPER